MLLPLASLLAAATLSPGSRPATPPNLLVILADDVGIDLLGSYAAGYATQTLQPCTPSLDQLAATSVRFTNVWSNPVCSPTRAQLLTGKRGSHSGIGTITLGGKSNTNVGLQLSQPTFASVLTGYARAALGKWHVSDPVQDGRTNYHPVLMGFDSYAGTLYGPFPEYNDYVKTVTPPGGQLQGYNVYATTDTTDEALGLMEHLPEPWLLYVAYNAAHWPPHCPTDFGFDPADCQPGACPYDWCLDCADMVGNPLCLSEGVDACKSRAMVQAMDAKIGELLAAIDPADTAVIFTSDNGTPARAIVAPFDKSHAKGNLYQGGIQVPLLVRAPGCTPGVNHELVSMTDLFATIAELAGASPPPDPELDSLSLVPYLYPGSGGTPTPRTHLYSEFFDSNFIPVAGGGPAPGYVARFHHRAVRNDRFKLIEVYGWDGAANGCVTGLHFFQLADAPPQDPAAGPDPFEQLDLMPSQSSWTVEQQTAFADLTFQLSNTYPRLPTICD